MSDPKSWFACRRALVTPLFCICDCILHLHTLVSFRKTGCHFEKQVVAWIVTPLFCICDCVLQLRTLVSCEKQVYSVEWALSVFFFSVRECLTLDHSVRHHISCSSRVIGQRRTSFLVALYLLCVLLCDLCHLCHL